MLHRQLSREAKINARRLSLPEMYEELRYLLYIPAAAIKASLQDAAAHFVCSSPNHAQK
jgi:hypothetical protein